MGCPHIWAKTGKVLPSKPPRVEYTCKRCNIEIYSQDHIPEYVHLHDLKVKEEKLLGPNYQVVVCDGYDYRRVELRTTIIR